jgi:hypothetical protein
MSHCQLRGNSEEDGFHIQYVKNELPGMATSDGLHKRVGFVILSSSSPPCIMLLYKHFAASYTKGTGLFSGVKRLGRGVNYPPPISAEVKERVKIYLNSSSVPALQVTG